MVRVGGDVVIDDELFAVIVVVRVIGPSDSVVAVAEYFRLKPEGLACVRRAPDPEMAAFVVCLWSRAGRTIGEIEREGWAWHSVDCKERKPLIAVSILAAKVAGSGVEVC